jgi:hypothetical protein
MHFITEFAEAQDCKISVPTKEDYLTSLLPMAGEGGTRQAMDVDDLEGAYEQSQPWFHEQADRAYACELLKDQECGTFLVRPSSLAGNYVISRVDEKGEVRHRLIYRLYPGFSPLQAPEEPVLRYNYTPNTRKINPQTHYFVKSHYNLRTVSVQQYINRCSYYWRPVVCQEKGLVFDFYYLLYLL